MDKQQPDCALEPAEVSQPAITRTQLLEKLHADLTAAGWRFEKPMKDTGVDWHAWRRLTDATDCACNDKPPSLVLIPYSYSSRGIDYGSAEFEIVGEVAIGRWLTIKAYSVPLDQVMESIPECTDLLRTAWNAAAQWSTDSVRMRDEVAKGTGTRSQNGVDGQ
jgi:hypothetical protein